MNLDSSGTEKALVSTPLGFIELTAIHGELTGLHFRDYTGDESVPESLAKAANQLKQYFRGELKTFDLPLNLRGSEFQRSVWKLLGEIPYGSTTTYGEIAARLNIRNGARAVGLANGSNPVSIVIPCHRVIGQNGKLTGYAGGLWRKEWLLKMEGSNTMEGLFSK
ncbi:MAG: methylated-DNA--[protein]-cysteine S-methyltransferase [Lentimicrobium sp.]